MFEWLSFLDRHNIPHQEKGGVTTRGNIAIHCPFCGGADRSYHLSISVLGKGWYCWRDKRHRGLQPHRLIQALLRCSYLEADAIAGGNPGVPDDQMMLDVMAKMDAGRPKPTGVAKKPLALPPEFVEIRDRGFRRQFVGYLHGRGFADPEAVAADYGLLGAVEGRYAGRVIFPIHLDGELVCWTGRHVGASRLRYLTLSSTDDPPARLPVKQTLLWYDRLKAAPAGATLIVTEGPFDALKVNYLGRDHGIYATCLYGKNISHQQVDLLMSFNHPRQIFARKITMVDSNTKNDMLPTLALLREQHFKSMFIEGIKDPGEFDRESFDRFLKTI